LTVLGHVQPGKTKINVDAVLPSRIKITVGGPKKIKTNTLKITPDLETVQSAMQNMAKKR